MLVLKGTFEHRTLEPEETSDQRMLALERPWNIENKNQMESNTIEYQNIDVKMSEKKEATEWHSIRHRMIVSEEALYCRLRTWNELKVGKKNPL